MKQKRLMAGALRPSGLLRTGAAALALLVLSACSFGASQTSQKSFSDTEASSQTSSGSQSISQPVSAGRDDADLYTDWSAENPVYITLNGDSIEVEGSGVSLSGSVLSVDVCAYATQAVNNGETVFEAKGWPAPVNP